MFDDSQECVARFDSIISLLKFYLIVITAIFINQITDEKLAVTRSFKFLARRKQTSISNRESKQGNLRPISKMQLQTILTYTLIALVLLCMVQGTEAHSKEEEYLASFKKLEDEFGDIALE